MHICVRCNAHLNLAFLYVHLYSIWLFNSLLFLVFFCGEIVKALFFVPLLLASYARHSHSCIHMILWFTLDFICATIFFIIRVASSDCYCHCMSLLCSWWWWWSSSYECIEKKIWICVELIYRSEWWCTIACMHIPGQITQSISMQTQIKKRVPEFHHIYIR